MDQYMEMAIAEAEEGIKRGDGGPFGAVIVLGGKVIGKGHNQVLKNNDPTCHGEIMAIHAACHALKNRDLQGAVMYTTAYPCPMCLGAILWANIEKVYYGCDLVDTAAIGFRDEAFYEKLKTGEANGLIQELGRADCLRLFEDYLRIASRKNY
jgi:guanine deaminase